MRTTEFILSSQTEDELEHPPHHALLEPEKKQEAFTITLFI